MSGLLFSFPDTYAQGPIDRAGEISVVLIFDICSFYEIVAYDRLNSHYRGRVKMVDMVSKFLGNIEDWRVFLVC